MAPLASGGWPVVQFGVSFALNRRLDELAGLALVFIVLGVVAGLGFNSARLVLVKESAVTGLFGIVTLGSLELPRPLMFYFGRKFATDGAAMIFWTPAYGRRARAAALAAAPVQIDGPASAVPSGP